MRQVGQRKRVRPVADHSVQRLRCGTYVPPLQLDATDLDALLGVVRAKSVVELEEASARLRSLLGKTRTILSRTSRLQRPGCLSCEGWSAWPRPTR
jgi:hypothetical protein